MFQSRLFMNALQLRFISAAFCFLLILPSGFLLSRSGRPYGLVLFNVHKLIAVGMLVFLAINVYRLNQATPLGITQLTACLIAAVCFVATIITGGLVSTAQPMPAAVSLAHRLLP
jgi:hypothetical protein